MEMKFITNVMGLGKASGYYISNANFPLKEDLAIGTLVALGEDLKLVKADDVNKPLGVVFYSTPVKGNKIALTGSVDGNLCKAGTRVELYKLFLTSGTNLKGKDWTTAKIGDDVYLEAKGVLTTTKPSKGWRVGIVERCTDHLVRFDLVNVLKIGA